MKRQLQDDISRLLHQIDQPDPAPSPDDVRMEIEVDSTTDVPTVHVYLFNDSKLEEEHDKIVDGSIADEGRTPNETQARPYQYPHWVDFLLFVVSMLVLGASTLIPIFNNIVMSPATVIIQPTMRLVEFETAITLPGRELPFLTLAQSKMVEATGKGYQEARSASGLITLYNALPTPQYVEADTILTGASGIEVMLDQGVTIPAGNGATNGQTTVAAYTLKTGTGANIEAYDINGPCCMPYVLARNPAPFNGGQDARAFVVVTEEDITLAENDMQSHLQKNMQTVFTAQAQQGEAITSPSCTTKTSTSHNIGEEAQEVTIIVGIACTASAYSKEERDTRAREKVNQEALKQLGSHYALFGDVRTSTVNSDQQRGLVALTIQASGNYGYQFTQEELDHLKAGIAGKSQKEATAWLKNQPGVWLVVIDRERLPDYVASLEIAIFCTK